MDLELPVRSKIWNGPFASRASEAPDKFQNDVITNTQSCHLSGSFAKSQNSTLYPLMNGGPPDGHTCSNIEHAL